MSNLLYPGPIQSATGAPAPQPAPMIPQQQLQAPTFAQRFQNNMGPILQALGYGIAANDLSRGAAMIPGLADRRQEQLMQQQQMAQEQQRRNATFEWAKTQDPEVAQMLGQGIIEPMDAVRLIQQKRQGKERNLVNAGDGRLYDADTNQWITAPGGSGLEAEVQQRRVMAEQMGLKPGDPAYQPYILTGKFPREDQAPLSATDKKAILEADEQVMANQNAISMIEEAEALNSKAYEGANASARAETGTKYWDFLVPDSYADPQKSADTVKFSNIVMNQALTSLKSIFGGNPTEGERAILVELQASVDKPADVRADILKRAKRLAQIRLDFNKKRAEEMRGGTYYKTPQAETAPAPGQRLKFNPATGELE